MTITALPPATVHLLGSAQVLTTPASLIKELIDNSLDAKATSIDIFISKNTLDKLEVRDNGHGIASEDFDALGKRGHTSKLRSFEELRLLGGATLGFRGEALASAVQLGEVSVTTKTEGESVATKLLLKAPGGIDRRTHTSHPVGTTVTVTKFMSKLPVRHKNFEKAAPKTLAKVNQLLRAYALARPSVRFSLKVMSGGKGSWSFAPRPTDDVKEVVCQVIGRDAAMECIEKSFVSSVLQSRYSTPLSGKQDTAELSIKDNSHHFTEDECFVIEAFLPKPNADVSKVGTGQYLSIDSRPVSHEKGTMKKFVALFKKYMRDTLSDSSEKLESPFIRLNIKCPVASYDANVEPAKDDVLFGNEEFVLDLAENLLKEVYGERKANPPVSTPYPLIKKLGDFELLLARKPPPPSESLSPTPEDISLPQLSPGSLSDIRQPYPSKGKDHFITDTNMFVEAEKSPGPQRSNRRQKLGFDVSADYDEGVEDGSPHFQRSKPVRSNPQQTPDRELSGVEPLNPWIIAKMNAPSSRDLSTSENSRSAPRPTTADVYLSSRLGHDQLDRYLDVMESPSMRRRQPFGIDNIPVVQPDTRSSPAVANCPRFEDSDKLLLVDRDLPRQCRRRNDFVSARNLSEASLMSPPSTHSSKGPPRIRVSNKPSMPPFKELGFDRTSSLDSLIQTTLSVSNGPPQLQAETNPDVAWAMDFEQRKEDATRQRRKELRVARLDSSKSSETSRLSPHKNRYNAAIASLEVGQPCSHTVGQSNEPFKTTLPDGDPRAYLMRRQKSLAANRGDPGDRPGSIRTKSTKLPLESIPKDEHLHDLIHTIPTDMENLQRVMRVLSKEDTYVSRGNQGSGLAMGPSETLAMRKRLQDVVNLWIGGSEERRCEVEYSFGTVLDSESLSA